MEQQLKIEHVPVSDLNPAIYNPRVMPEAELNKLKKGLQEFGFVDPLVINQDGTVIGGHQRLRAAEALGFKSVPVVRLDVDKVREKVINLP